MSFYHAAFWQNSLPLVASFGVGEASICLFRG